MFASRLFKVLLIPVLALSVTALTGLLPLMWDSNFQSQGYHVCGVEVGHGFPARWVSSVGSPRDGLGQFCGTNLTIYDWWIFGLDSLLSAGLGYVVLIMPRLQNNRLFIGLSATYLGYFTTLAVSTSILTAYPWQILSGAFCKPPTLHLPQT